MRTADIQAGDVVKIRKECDGDDQLYLVAEWNGDRGFIIPHDELDDAEYLFVLEQLGFGRIGTGGGCDALSKTLPDGREVLITTDGDPSVPRVTERAQISIDDVSETDLDAVEVLRRAFALAQL